MKEIEILEKRKEKEKHFLQENGDIIARVYSDNIHFFKDNKFEEIDNTLIKTDNYYTNINNDYKVYFGENSRNGLMKIKVLDDYINIYLKDSSETYLTNNSDSVIYEDIIKGIDLQYILMPTKVKENIIIKDKSSLDNKLNFTIDTNLELVQNDNKTICAIKGNKTIFVMEAPYMMDSNKVVNNNIYYILNNKNNIYTLELILDKDWLNDDDILYPVVIDPTITNSGQDNNVFDTYIYPNDTNVNRNGQDILKAGVERINGQDIVNRTLLKFTLPTIGTGSQITNARVSLIGYPIAAGHLNTRIIDAHKITSDWVEETANWETMNDKYDSRIETVFYSGRSYIEELGGNVNAVYNSLIITDLVKKWYSNTPNYGIMLKEHEENFINKDIAAYFSKNNSVTGFNPKPILEITYRNQNGLESYMDYSSQSLNLGKTFINNYNGNLTGVFNIGSTVAGKLPVSLNLIYNTNDVVLNNDLGYGLGYKLNLQQTIKKVLIEEILYLEYVDEDGTIHYFKEDSGIFKDEDGLSMTITQSDTEYTLKDKSNNKIIFNKNNDIGYLSEIVDIKDNKITVYYNSDNLIYKIKDSNDAEISIVYEEDKISIVSPDRITYLNYTDNKLISISSLTGTTLFQYNNYNILSIITDETGKQIKYDYYDEIPYRIKNVTEYGLENSKGNYFTLKYGFDSTTLIDNRERATTIIFNNNGNVVSTSNLTNNVDIKNAYSKANTYSEPNATGEYYNGKNKLLTRSVPIKYVNNLLTNTSFENDNIEFVADSNVIMTISEEFFNNGNRSLKISTEENSKFIMQSIVVPKGYYYTFSAFLKNTNSLKLSMSYVDENNEIIEKDSELINNNIDFYRYDNTIYYPKTAVSDLIIKVKFETSGVSYIDDIQLEEGDLANNYNVLENSDFSKGFNGWIVNATKMGTDEEVSSEQYFDVVDINDLGKKALRIKMDPNFPTSVVNKINIAGKAGDVYTISFWYKNEGIQADWGLYPNNVLVSYDYIDQSNGHGLFPSTPLNPNSHNWQYFSYRFGAEKDYRSVKLQFFQTFNANDLYITNLSLYKDIRAVGYNYDGNGNVISTSNLNNDISDFKYDKNNQLIQMTNPRGKNFKFEYDNVVTDQVLAGISGTGISNRIKYDSFGNPITTQIINNSLSETLENALYAIRMKGTDKYLKYVNNTIALRHNSHKHGNWIVEKIDDYYRIKYSVLDNRYFTVQNGILSLKQYTNDNSLFSLIKNKNGSYLIKLKSENKYIKNNNNNNMLEVVDLEEDNFNFEFYFEIADNKLFIENSAEYTEDGRFVKTTTDTNFNKTTYDIDPLIGLTNSVTNAKNQTTYYTYNNKKQITSVSNGNKRVDYLYNGQNLIDRIKQGTKEYKFEYDEFLNAKSVKIGDDITLITNNYETNNGNLVSSIYGNNNTVDFAYDDFDRISSISKMNDIYTYKYGSNGDLVKIISNYNITRFNYDLSKRLIDYIFDNFRIKYDYDSNNNVIDKTYKLDDISYNINNELNDDDAITKIEFNDNNINYNYDYLGRLTNSNINNNCNTNYEYVTNGKRTSLLVKSIENNGDKISYRYDKLNNITHIYNNNKLINKYFYDEYNELIKENNYLSNETIGYKYDNSGNIISKKVYELDTYNLIKQDKYEYGDIKWEDKLTKFNNDTITYDQIGNPLTIGDNIVLSWVNGRELNSYTDSNNTINYKYNSDGFRTNKIVNGTNTNYYLEGNNIVFEKTGNNVLYYIRSNVDELIGFKYNNDLYYYIKNAQDDIIGIMDSNYSVVARYEYDSWGNIVSIKDSNNNDVSNDSNHIANINPFRYRSYYYDKETKLYYLNSRYYNPIWCRFINPDGIGGANNDILSQNLYAYVSNDPINNCDPTGTFLKKLFKKVVNFVSSIFDYSITKATPAGALKPNNPIPSTATTKQKAVNNKIIDTVANSKIEYSIGLSGGSTFLSGNVSYGGTVSPNAGINKNSITAGGGISLSIGLPISPTVSFSFQPNYKGGFTNSNGWNSPYASFGAGIHYSTDNIYGITLSPSFGTDVGVNYTWEWDKKGC